MFEEPLYPSQSSFSRGEVDPALYGRVDLQAYGAALRTSRNGFIRTEGSWTNRPGTQYLGSALTTTINGSVLIPFTFNVGQSYVIEVGTGSNGIQVFSQGVAIVAGVSVNISNVQTKSTFAFIPVWYVKITTAVPHGLVVGMNVTVAGITGNTQATQQNGYFQVITVQDPSSFITNAPVSQSIAVTYTGGGTVQRPAQFASPYLAAELPQLRYSQSADTLTIVHQNHPPYEFKRTSATTFSFQPGVYNNGPFAPLNSDGTTLVYASAISGSVTLVASKAIFNANQVGGLFYLGQQDLTPIFPWEPSKLLVGPGAALNPVGQNIRSNLKNYKCVAADVSTSLGISTGSVAPSHTTGTQWDGNRLPIVNFADHAGVAWQFQDFAYGVVQITAFTSSTQVTATVMPVVPGQPALLPISVVGPRTTTNGPYNFTGDGATTAFSPMVGVTQNDPNKYFVTVAGVWVPPSGYTITIGGPNTITFVAPPANLAAIVVREVNGLFATTFWAFGAFSADQGYPGAITYFPDRLIFGGTIQQPVGIFGSRTSDYHNFAVSAPIVNSDAFTVFLNARQLNAISDLIPLQDLIVGTANILWRLWPGVQGTALGPLSISATPQAFVGEHTNAAAVLYGDSALYVTYGGRRIRDLLYQFSYDKYTGTELTSYSRHLVPYGTNIVEMCYAPDPWTMLFALRSDGTLLSCTYVRDQQMTAWSRWDTQGIFDDVVVVPENGSYSVYVTVNRTINGAAVRYVERLAQRESTSNLDWCFADSSLKYDGRNTSATTMTLNGGTTWLAGDTATLNASGTTGWANFISSDPVNNNVIQLFDASGNMARVLITAYTSPTIASVRFMDPIPASLRATPTAVWTFARTTFTGAQSLANTAAAVLADSNALTDAFGNPYLVVDAGGSIVLPSAFGVVTIGLQYLSDFETLSLNQQGQETVRERSKTIPALYLDVTGTRGLFAGTDFTQANLCPFKMRDFEGYLSPTSTQEGIINNRLYSQFDSESHVCIRQPYPLPVTIRMVIPSVGVGEPVG